MDKNFLVDVGSLLYAYESVMCLLTFISLTLVAVVKYYFSKRVPTPLYFLIAAFFLFQGYALVYAFVLRAFNTPPESMTLVPMLESAFWKWRTLGRVIAETAIAIILMKKVVVLFKMKGNPLRRERDRDGQDLFN